MKIKEVLAAFVDLHERCKQEKDTSDTWTEESDVSRAAEAAQAIIDSVALRDVFDPGHEVVIGDVTGIVENVDIVYEVRITDANGNRRYGRFASEYVGPPIAPLKEECFSDRDGDVWQDDGITSGCVTLIEHEGKPVAPKLRQTFDKRTVVEQWGPLVPVKR